jgi:Ca2+-binding EF-hand superfamily protein
MNTSKALAAAAVCALCLCGAGCAGTSGLSKGAAALDANKDGKISRAEFIARYKQSGATETRFQRLDKSGDGFLDKNETGTYPDDYWAKTESNDEP